MRILLDYREAVRPKRTGKGQWTKGFVEELLKRNHDVVLLTDRAIENMPQCSVKTFSKGLLWHFTVARFVRSNPQDDLYVSPTSYIVPWLLGRQRKVVVVVHDLIAWQPGKHDRKARILERLLLPRVLRTAWRICTVSWSTSRDIQRTFPSVRAENIHAIFAGPFEEIPDRTISDGHTILCAATLCPRKNQQRLIEAYALLPEKIRSRYQLLLVGASGWQDASIRELARSTPGVRWDSYVSDATYRSLLSTCAIFALPSLYEGFGMQILDALQRGIPVLTSGNGSLQEVTQESAVLVDPESVPSIAKGLELLLTDVALQERLRQSGPIQAAQFSWKKTVDLFLKAIE